MEPNSKSQRNRGQHEATDPPKFWGVGLGFRAHLAIALPLPRNALHHRGEETTAGEVAYGGAARPVQHERVEHGHGHVAIGGPHQSEHITPSVLTKPQPN